MRADEYTAQPTFASRPGALTTIEVVLRAAYALHLALALSGGSATMLTFDCRLAEAARASGLGVYPDF